MRGYYHIEIFYVDPKSSTQIEVICDTLEDTSFAIQSSWNDDSLDHIEIDLPSNKITTFMMTFCNHIPRNSYYQMILQ